MAGSIRIVCTACYLRVRFINDITMKTLIIITYPTMSESTINKRWTEGLLKFPEKYTVHQLYDAYPDEMIDVHAEQRLVRQYD